MRESKSTISADYLTASSPSELRRLLFELQASLGGQVKIISITYAQEQWVCWFYNDLDDVMFTEAFKKNRGK